MGLDTKPRAYSKSSPWHVIYSICSDQTLKIHENGFRMIDNYQIDVIFNKRWLVVILILKFTHKI